MPGIELWLKSIGLEKYAEVFARHDVDLDVAPNLSEQDLEKLGLSLGHRRKFLAAVAKLRTGGAQATYHPAQADITRQEAGGVERRQVTVLFSDLVGSTALHLRDTPLRLLRAQCSPYHGNTVLYPIAESGVSAFSDRTAPEIIDADRLSAALG